MAEPQGDAKLHDDEAESDGGTELKDSKAESHGGDSEDASEGGAKLHGGETWYGDWQAAEVKAVRPRAEIELRQMIVKRHARNCYSSVISEDDNEIEFDATKISLPNACRLPLNAAIWAAEDFFSRQGLRGLDIAHQLQDAPILHRSPSRAYTDYYKKRIEGYKRDRDTAWLTALHQEPASIQKPASIQDLGPELRERIWFHLTRGIKAHLVWVMASQPRTTAKDPVIAFVTDLELFYNGRGEIRS